MAHLRIGKLPNTASTRLTLTIPGDLHDKLNAYCQILKADGQATDLRQLVPYMLDRFIAGDREFARRVRARGNASNTDPSARTRPPEIDGSKRLGRI